MFENAKETINSIRNLNAWNRNEDYKKRFDAEVEVFARNGETEMVRLANLHSIRNGTTFRAELEKQINAWLDERAQRMKAKHDAAVQKLAEQTTGLEDLVTELKSELGISFIHGIKNKNVIVDECSDVEALINEYEAFQTIRDFTAIKITKMEFVVGRKVFSMGGDF